MARFVLGGRTMQGVGGVFVVLWLGACGGGSGFDDGEACPASLTDGDACDFTGQCWRDNTFSSCLSEWCTCEAGRVHCEPLTPRTGDACGAEPIFTCSYEGNPGCTTAPTGEVCTCSDEGTWRCQCACYGASSTCGTCPVGLALDEINGIACETAGTACPYAEGTCTCVSDNAGNRFQCAP